MRLPQSSTFGSSTRKPMPRRNRRGPQARWSRQRGLSLAPKVSAMSQHTSPASSSDREIIARAKRLSIKDRRSRERVQARPNHSDLKLSIEHVPIGSVRAYRRRLRKSSNALQEKLEASICAFGLVLPFLVDSNGVLIDGHALFEAAKAVGLSEVAVVRASHLGEAQIKALRIALNRLPELNTWDEAALALEFKELLALELSLDLSFDLSITGFSHPEIDQLVETSSVASTAEARDDVVPEVDETPPVSRLGDVWLLGDHKIICGDATIFETYRVLLGEERAAMGISDAPYNLKISGNVSNSGRHGEFVMASGEMSKDEFTHFLTRFLQGSTAMVRPGAIQFVFMDWRHMT